MNAITGRVYRPRTMLAALALAILTLYTLTYRGVAALDDETVMLNVTANLVDLHTLKLFTRYPVLHNLPDDPNAPVMSKFGIGQTLLGAPLYALGYLLPVNDQQTMTLGNQKIPFIPYHTAMFLGTIITLLTAFGVLQTVRLLSGSLRVGAFAAILFAVTTVAWPYAKSYFSEPTVAFAVIWHVYFLIRFRREGQRWDGLLSGAFLGFTILTRTTSLVFAPLAFLYLLPDWKRWRLPLIGVVVSVAIVLVYDQYRYGSPFLTGYEGEWNFGNPIGEALLAFVFSPTRSIFLYDPVLILSIPGAWWLLRKFPRETAYLLLLIGVHTLVFSMWYFWDGGGALSARFLVPIVPLGVVLLTPLFSHPRWRNALTALAVFGFALQILNNLIDYVAVAFDAGLPKLDNQLWTWQLSTSYITHVWSAYLNSYNHQHIDSWVFQALAIADPYLRAGLFALCAALLVGAMVWAAQRLPDAPHVLSTETKQEPIPDHVLATSQPT